MDKLARKRNASSMQVLKTLNALLEGDFKMEELIDYLNSKESYPIFNNSVISKYINTLRYCGMSIPKINNHYYVVKIPFGLKLEENEITLLGVIHEVAKETLSTKSLKIFDRFIEKLNRFSNKKIARIDKKDYKISFELFARAIKQRKKVNLIFKNKYELTGIPLSISYENGKTFFNVFNKRIRKIDISRLSGIRTLNDKFSEPSDNSLTVVFKLKGNLAKRYQIRNEYETLVNMPVGENEIVVANKGEDKEVLLSRLMRYDNKCEILTPKSYRDDMKQLIEDTLKNYGE